jgi:hypothetical protein
MAYRDSIAGAAWLEGGTVGGAGGSRGSRARCGGGERGPGGADTGVGEASLGPGSTWTQRKGVAGGSVPILVENAGRCFRLLDHAWSLDDFVRPQQRRRRDRETEHLRDLQVVVNCSHTEGPLFSGEVLTHISVASVRSQTHSRDCLRQRLGDPGARGSIGFR